MKNSIYRLSYVIMIMAVFVLANTSCQKKAKLDANGLSKEINDLVPEYILTEIENLGMVINTGNTPPDLEASFYVSPFILKASNRPGDTPGLQFADYEVTLYEQNNPDLNIKYDYVNGPESGTGLGGFVVGENNDFSVFVEVTAQANGETVSLIHVISGTRVDGGIEDFYFANFMLDNNGNLNGYWIEDGEGRVVYDSDGYSPETSKKSSPEETKLPSTSLQ